MAVADVAVKTQPPAEAVEERAATMDVDLAAMATAFCQRLHQSDMLVTPAQSEHYAMSLSLTRPSSLRRLYFTTRAIFVTDADQEETFERVFAEIFGAYTRTEADDLVSFDAA